MNLPDIISESLVEDSFFGQHAKNTIYKAIKQHPSSAIKGVTHLGVSVLRISAEGIAHHHNFTIDDILDIDWELRESSNILNMDRPQYNGIVNVNEEDVEFVVNLFENGGYGSIDSYSTNDTRGNVSIFCRSHLFDKLNSGESTPTYTLIYEGDIGSLNVKRN